TRSEIIFSSHCLGAHGFMFYFTPRRGVLFTFPSRYYFAIGHPGVFSLARWSLLIHTGFPRVHATRDRA
ncbi:ORF44l, partial [Rhynchospora pubera]